MGHGFRKLLNNQGVPIGLSLIPNFRSLSRPKNGCCGKKIAPRSGESMKVARWRELIHTKRPLVNVTTISAGLILGA